jgi:formylmethanofuran dehydrogenase subunit B
MPDPTGPVTCAGCGLLCDDVMVERVGDEVHLTPECRLGAEWFAARWSGRAGTDSPAAAIDGAPVDVDAALARAAELLRGARRPLVHGFAGATVEDARAAVALADHLGALVTTGTVTGPWPGAPAAPLRGASTATLGEIRDRSRLVVIWRQDPEATHPRLLSRLGLADGERTLVVIDDRDSDTARRADLRLRWPAERDLEALVTLHALARGVASHHGAGDGDGLAGPLGELLERIGDVPHVTFIYGAGLTEGAGGQRRALALFELVRALSPERHVVTLALPPAAGTRGADDVLAWQTGYAGAVDLAGGHPELVTATEPLLAAEDVDVAVRVEGVPAPGLTGVTEIAFGLPLPDVAVSIRTAAPGVEAGGTAHRLDGAPLALQAPAAGDAPTAADLLTRLLAEVTR